MEGKVVVFCGEDGIAARVQGDHGLYLLFREPEQLEMHVPGTRAVRACRGGFERVTE